MDAPGPLQRTDVGGRDLGQRAVTVGALIVVAGRPADRSRRLLCDAHGAGGCRNDYGCTQSRHECRHGYPRYRSWGPIARPHQQKAVILAGNFTFYFALTARSIM